MSDPLGLKATFDPLPVGKTGGLANFDQLLVLYIVTEGARDMELLPAECRQH
jgi:hypothetical protein